MNYKKDEGRIPDWIEHIAKWSIMIIVVLGMIFAFVFFFMMFYNVPVGEAVLLVDPLSRTVSEPIIGPTFGVKMPWVGAVYVYYATDVFEDEIPCFSADQLEMQIQVLIRWSLDPGKIRELYHNYPHLNYKEKAIESIMEKTIRLVTKNYTTLETIEHRDVVVHIIEQAVFKEIKEEVSLVGSLTHLEMDVKNIAYPPKYTSAIEDKLVAEQQQIQAEFERDRILILADAEAKQKVIYANGTAEAMRLIKEEVGEEGWNIYYSWQQLQKVAPYVKVLIIAPDENGMPIFYTIPGD